MSVSFLPPGLALVAGALLLHARPGLPDAAWLPGLAAAAFLSRLAAGLLARVGLPKEAALLACVAWVLAGFGWAAWNGARTLADRLDPALEGRDIVVEGVVADLPTVRGDGSLAFRFDVERVVDPPDARLPATVRLSWRAARPRFRAPDRPARGEDSSAEPEDDPAGAAREDRPRDGRTGDGHAHGDPEGGAPARHARTEGGSARDASTRTGAGPDAGTPAVDTKNVGVHPAAGERWRWTVRLRRPRGLANPHTFDTELRMAEEGIGATGHVRVPGMTRSARAPVTRLDALAMTPGAWIAAARAGLRNAILAATESVPGKPDGRGMLVALAVGDQAALPAELWTGFNRTGIGHLMSISGLHITMLAALAGGAAGWLWRRPVVARLGWPLALPRPKARIVVAVLAAGGYSLLAGWGIPAQRTFWMLAVAALALVTGRAGSILSTLAVAVAVVTVLDPLAPLAPGFWLSFCAVAAIVWLMGDESARPPKGEPRGAGLRRALSAAVSTQWAATLSLLPLSVVFFGAVSVVGPLANAVAIPVVSGVLTPAILGGAALALLSPWLAAWVLVPCAWIAQWTADGTRWLSAFDWAAFEVAAPGWPALLLAALGVAWLLGPRGLPLRGAAPLLLVPLLLPPSTRPEPGSWRVTAFDVGQGTAVLVETATRTLLVDAGPKQGEGADAATRVLIPWLRARGITKLDGYVVSHPDADHDGGTASLLAARQVGWMMGESDADPALLARVPRRLDCVRDDGWHWDGVDFVVLHPGDEPAGAAGSASNARSCVLRVDGPGGSVLLPGDIEAAQERALVERDAGALRADLLLVPHHGSRTSSTEDFLDAVAPRWAVFQQAWRSPYGHPHPMVMARYDARGIGSFRSDRDGMVQAEFRADAPPRFVLARHEPARWWRVRWDDARDAHPPRPSARKKAGADGRGGSVSASSPGPRSSAP